MKRLSIARRAEQASVVLIMVGILCMVQPIKVDLLAYGFVVTLIGLVGFIITSHL
ncbi:MAG TPA: hypothetical protein VHB98_15030 [Chloroflexota bacterium]|jgi:hypothetical protein|nr:hypothetical protein [Chloroflexota bacterium]